MPSNGRGAYRAARSATRALNEHAERTDADIAGLMEALAVERARAEEAEARIANAVAELESYEDTHDMGWPCLSDVVDGLDPRG